MSEERKKILNMLSEGRISVDEAERLIAAIESGKNDEKSETIVSDSPELPKYLRVKVESAEGGSRDRVNIRVPFQLLKAGIKLSSLLPGEAKDKVDRAFAEKGIDFDVSKFKADDLEEIVTALRTLSIDITSDDGDQVKVFCE